MTIKVVGSEVARNQFREMIDTAMAGGETVIERHGKPTAVLVPYEQWQRWRKQRGLDLLTDVRRAKERFAKGETGFTSHDELKRLILERRTREADDHAGVGN